MGLSVAAREIGHQLGQNHITDAATYRPLPILLLRSSEGRREEPASRNVALDVHEIIVAENADYEIVELIIAARTHGAEPATPASCQIGADGSTDGKTATAAG